MPSRARVTVRTLAEYSGWSLGTVSRVLNHAGDVNEKAVADITRAAKELGYRPNTSARDLRRQGRSGVLILVRSSLIERYAELSDQIAAALRKEGESFARYECSSLERMEALIEKHSPFCLLLAGFRRDDIMNCHGRMKIPAIVVGADLSRYEARDLFCFGRPDTEIALQACEALFLSGCCAIGFVGVDRDLCSEAADAVLGIQYAFYARDRVFSFDEFYSSGTPDFQGGYDAFIQLCSRHPELDGLLVFDPKQALGVLRAAADRGVQIGSKIKVICLQDDPAFDYSIPRLSRAVSLDSEACEEIVRCLKKVLHQKRGVSECAHESFSYSLRFEESCSNPLLQSEIK